MKNNFEVRGNEVAIFLKEKSGEKIETIIDRSLLEFVDSFPHTWSCYWHKGTNSYYVKGDFWSSKRRVVRLHRFLMGEPKGKIVDHINHDTLDNRLNNLRIVTSSQNNRNRKETKGCSSKFKGVFWSNDRKKYRAKINGIYLGTFDDEKKAAEAYNKAATKIFEEYAYLNKLNK